MQVVLVALIALLGKALLLLDYASVSWPLCVIVCAIVASIAWLVTMYFTMVDNANKLGAVVEKIGHAVGEARDAN